MEGRLPCIHNLLHFHFFYNIQYLTEYKLKLCVFFAVFFHQNLSLMRAEIFVVWCVCVCVVIAVFLVCRTSPCKLKVCTIVQIQWDRMLVRAVSLVEQGLRWLGGGGVQVTAGHALDLDLIPSTIENIALNQKYRRELPLFLKGNY